MVNLMKGSCGIEFAEASKEIEVAEIKGVVVPFASVRLLWRTKQTQGEKDALDQAFLAELLKRERSRDD